MSIPHKQNLHNLKDEEHTIYVTELPCGCRRGSFLCPTAVQLWQEVGMAYKRAQASSGTWEEYDAARAAYSEHYKEIGRVQP